MCSLVLVCLSNLPNAADSIFQSLNESELRVSCE